MYAEVIFPIPFSRRLTYLVPAELREQAVPGVRVTAPLEKRIMTGFIYTTRNELRPEEAAYEIKPLREVLDPRPLLLPSDFSFYEWIAEYYHCSPGEAFRLAIPAGSEVQTKKIIAADSEAAAELYAKEKNPDSPRARVLKVLSQKKQIALKTLQKESGVKGIYSLLGSLAGKGVITIHDELQQAKGREKRIKIVRLAKEKDAIYEELPAIERKSEKQFAVLYRLLAMGDEYIPAADLMKETGTTPAVIAALMKKKLITLDTVASERVYKETYSEEKKDITLTPEQAGVVEAVSETLNKNLFKVWLLHGVTGSGKTQVYIELLKKVLDSGKNAIMMVPEISLTPQMTARLVAHFGDDVSVIHSKFSHGERFDTRNRILEGRARIVVGPRSALFTPVRNVGIIIIDEEHDASYKQMDGTPRYHARDCAIYKAHLEKIPVLLGSATPSVESMYNTETGKYTLLKLENRVDGAEMPLIRLVNVVQEKKLNRMASIFAYTMLEKIKERVEKKEGVIILQNRRGFATQMFCFDCGTVQMCDNCTVPMVLHINRNMLKCHYCGYTKPTPEVCGACGSSSIKFFGTGTERVEDEISFYFPAAKIARIDSDSVSRKGLMSETLSRFREEEIDILVGTQLVSKGLDFSRVTLVGVISAEATLWMPDFRADERTFQLLTQVAGRAGRSSKPGEVVIQTQNDHHFVLQRVLDGKYYPFYYKEIGDRIRLEYPPITRMCLIEARDKDELKARETIMDFHKCLMVYKDTVKITAPSTAVIARLRTEFRYQILIKSNREKDPGGSVLRAVLKQAHQEFLKLRRHYDVKVTFDIDPQSIM